MISYEEYSMKVHILHKSVVLMVFQKDILDILLIEGTHVRGHLGLPIPSLFPDIFSQKPAVAANPRENCPDHSPSTPPQSPLLRSTEARDTRTSDGEAETARDNGTGRSTEGDSRGDNLDENERSTENEDENAFLNTVAEKLEKLKRVSSVTGVLGFKDRNNSFNRVVLDRRGRGAPKLVGASHDVVFTCDTGTEEIDIYFKENNHIIKIACLFVCPRGTALVSEPGLEVTV